MRLLTSTFALLLSLVVVNAASLHDNANIAARHAHLSKRVTSLEMRASNSTSRRCKKNRNTNKASTPAANNLVGDKATSSAPPPAKTSAAPAKNNNNNGGTSKPVNAAGLINVQSNCGSSRATKEVTKFSGPNGHIDWLNCGFETDGGWQPPFVRVQDIITQPLSTALQNPSSPFKACARFIWMFEKYGGEYGIPAIMLASFAMQESSCNPETVGGGGEQGLMQITREKCGGAPGGNCRDPEFNIRTATRFFSDTLKNNGGNVLLSAGAYNGWHRGLTRWKAFAAANSACCRCQNNGDYLHQFFNGWCQNINAYDHRLRLGKYFNLDVCG